MCIFLYVPKVGTIDVKCGLWLSYLRTPLRLSPDGSGELWLSGPRESPWPRGLANTTPCPFRQLLSVQKSCGSFATANSPGDWFLVLGDSLRCFVYRKTSFCRIGEATQFVNFNIYLNCFTEESKPLILVFGLNCVCTRGYKFHGFNFAMLYFMNAAFSLGGKSHGITYLTSTRGVKSLS